MDTSVTQLCPLPGQNPDSYPYPKWIQFHCLPLPPLFFPPPSYFYFLHMNVLSAYMHHMCTMPKETEEGSYTLELELDMAVSCHVDAGI